jgi:hypothetical protein
VTSSRWALLATLALAGCSFLQLAYRNMDWFLLWRIDGYFDLTGAQRDRVREELKRALEWHRQAELPRYRAFVADLQTRVGRGLAAEDVRFAMDGWRAFLASIVDRVAPRIAEVLTELSPEQVDRYAREWADEHEKMVEEQFPKDPHLRAERRWRRAVDRFEEVVGKLSAEQRALVRERLATAPDSNPIWLAHREKQQARLLELLRARAGAKAVEDQVRAWTVRPEERYTDDERALTAAARERTAQLIVDIDRTLSADQRAHAVERLQTYADDFAALSR